MSVQSTADLIEYVARIRDFTPARLTNTLVGLAQSRERALSGSPGQFSDRVSDLDEKIAAVQTEILRRID